MNGHRPESLLRLLWYLVGWFVVTSGLAYPFVWITPPGGVAPQYFLVMLLVPAAVFFTARHYPRWSVPICYGAFCGEQFAWPVFVDSRTDLSLEFGYLKAETLIGRILNFTVVVVALCILSFALWRHFQRSKRDYTPYEETLRRRRWGRAMLRRLLSR